MSGRRHRAEAWGRKAEARAALWLRLKGYRILKQRFKTPMGEVDLIARRGRTVTFVEIKARETLKAGLEAVTPKARQRIARAAEAFLAQWPGQMPDVRFDLCVVSPRRLPYHVVDAWRLDDPR